MVVARQSKCRRCIFQFFLYGLQLGVVDAVVFLRVCVAEFRVIIIIILIVAKLRVRFPSRDDFGLDIGDGCGAGTVDTDRVDVDGGVDAEEGDFV